MTNKELSKVFSILDENIKVWKVPIVTKYAQKKVDPYKILISTLISLRTKDAVTASATDKLWAIADNPYKISAMKKDDIAKAIYPAGFYNTKAENIKKISEIIVNKYNGKVPDTVDELVLLKGVGRKTANLVVSKGFNKLAICVDTHVHRITNRWGYVNTKTPDSTEMALRKKLPEKYWISINDVLVTYGQNLCLPVSPYCSKCGISMYCPKNGVKKSR